MPYPEKLWVIVTRAIVSPEELRPHIEAHLRHQVELEKSGVLFGAGPLKDSAGASTGSGMIIIRAPDAETATRIADSDPMHRNGLRSYTLQSWSLNEGRLTVTIDLSDNRSALR